nr:unnamed protein product [Callosobruchus chinensis]
MKNHIVFPKKNTKKIKTLHSAFQKTIRPINLDNDMLRDIIHMEKPALRRVSAASTTKSSPAIATTLLKIKHLLNKGAQARLMTTYPPLSAYGLNWCWIGAEE